MALESFMTNPLAPGTTPASLSTTATPNNPEGAPQASPAPDIQNPLDVQTQPGSNPQSGVNPRQAPTAPASPGSFGAKILQAVTGILSGTNTAVGHLGDAANAVGPGGGLGAVARTLEARKQREQSEQQLAMREKELNDQESQQKRIQQREDDESAARIAMSNVQMHSVMQNAYYQDTAYQDKLITQGQADLKAMESAEVPANVIQSGITGDHVSQLLGEGKINGHEYTAIPTGKKPLGQDKNGNPTYQFLYDIVEVPKTWTPSADQIERIKTVPGYEKYQPGTQLSGAQTIAILRQADTIKAAQDTMKKARVQSEIDDMTEAQRSSSAQFNKDGSWVSALNSHQGDPIAAAHSILQDPNMVKKYGSALYGDVMNEFASKEDPTGTSNFEKMRHDLADENAKEDENKLKKAGEDEYKGDPTLTGDAFLKSMNPKSAALVKAAGDGKMRIGNLGYLISKNPGFAEAVALYAPDFDGSKVDAYNKALIEYNDDKAGSVGGTINAGATALRGLRKLYDDTNAASLVPGSKANRDRQNDIATVANEVAKFNAGGRQPSTQDVEDLKKSLDPTIFGTGGTVANPINRREPVKNQVELLQKKIEEMELDWHNKAPSPRYEIPMPNMSNAARIDSAYVLNDGKYTVPRGAEGFVDPKTNHQVFTFDGKTYYDASNGQVVNPTTPGAK